MKIEQNLLEIKKRIENAANKSNREGKNIKLVAVTKYVEVDIICELIKNGVSIFGESKVQDFTKKYEKFNKEYEWHFIGHLQKNKVKYIVDKVKMIHSVDKLDLVAELNKRAKNLDISVDILVQLNISKEVTKFGVYENNIYEFIKNLYDYKNINLKGFMTMAPYECNVEKNRYIFQKAKEIFDIYKSKLENSKIEYLSMGMSNDFEIAIEEGANIVRIGSLLVKK